MKAEDFVFAMNETSDKYIIEPFEEKKGGKAVPFRKWAALAACICLVVISATVAIAEVFNIDINFFDYYREDRYGNYDAKGYKLNYNLGFHSLDSFGPMEEMMEGLADNKKLVHASDLPPEDREKFIELYGAESAWVEFGGELEYKKVFRSREEMIEYVGFEGLEFPDTKLRDETAEVLLMGYAIPSLKPTQLRVSLVDNHISDVNDANYIRYSATIRFSESEGYDEIKFGGDEGETFTEESFVNDNGIEYFVVKTITAEGNIRSINAYLIKNNIFYSAAVHNHNGKADLQKYEDFIHDWANAY